MSRHRAQLAEALAAVTIRPGYRYRWLGRTSGALAPGLLDALRPDERRDQLVRVLGSELYWSFYTTGGVVPPRAGALAPVSGDPRLAEAITAANTGSVRWDDGWTPDRVEGGAAIVRRGRLRVRVPVPQANGHVRLPVASEHFGLSPGYVTLLGDAGDALDEAVVRVYWHVTSGGAAALVRVLTSRLNAGTIPFRLKIADHPLRFDRCDAAVLYLGAEWFPPVRETLTAIADELRPRLRPRIPVFTAELAPGVGLAECVGRAESLGVRRCGLLASAIVAADEAGVGRASRLEFVCEHIARAGVDVDAPYREPALAGRHVL